MARGHVEDCAEASCRAGSVAAAGVGLMALKRSRGAGHVFPR